MTVSREKSALQRIDTRALLGWFHRNKRSLPWRSDSTPYSTWISETMLQQTVLDSMVSHFRRWMGVYPGVEALANASEREVLLLWEGLGYYNRARNLLKAAREMVDRHGAELPDSYDELIGLPGVGDYTARAILSIGFGKAYPVIEANVRRIGRRLLGWRSWDRGREKRLLALLEVSIRKQKPGDFNEALMELGQTVCLRCKPLCNRCPIAVTCLARLYGLQNTIPARRARPVVDRKLTLIIPLRGGEVFLVKQSHGILEGLWTFPAVERGDTALPSEPLSALTERTHHYTRYRERLLPFLYDIGPQSSPSLAEDRGRWISIGELDRIPLPSVYRRIARDLLEALHRLANAPRRRPDMPGTINPPFDRWHPDPSRETSGRVGPDRG